MQMTCYNCQFIGESMIESCTEEDGNCLIEYYCAWCDALLTLNDETDKKKLEEIVNSPNPLCKFCGERNVREEWGEYCSAECLKLNS